MVGGLGEALAPYVTPIDALSFDQVDDRDSSIVYMPAGAWYNGGKSDEFNGTTHVSYTPFSFLQFTFTGSSSSRQSIDCVDSFYLGIGIEIFGTTDVQSDGGFTFQIDDGPEERGSAHGGRVTGTSFVRIQNLANKEHTFG